MELLFLVLYATSVIDSSFVGFPLTAALVSCGPATVVHMAV